VTLDQLESAVDAVLAKIAADGVEPAELARAKTRLIADSVYAQDNQSRLARMYGAGLMAGMSVEDIQAWPDQIRKVDAESVRAAARKWIELRRAVTGRLLPPPNPTEKPS
jgi:zinc protease